MKKVVILFVLLITFDALAQKEIEAKELSKKEIRALLKAEKRKKEIEEFAKQGLNEYGIDEYAQTWFLALRNYIPGGKQVNGYPILRSAESFSTGRKFPFGLLMAHNLTFHPCPPCNLHP